MVQTNKSENRNQPLHPWQFPVQYVTMPLSSTLQCCLHASCAEKEKFVIMSAHMKTIQYLVF